MKLTQSIKKRSWNLTTGKVKIFLLILGAVLACSAPFAHMLFPKTNTQIVTLRTKFDNGLISEDDYLQKTEVLVRESRLFGFPNARKFWYAIGKPLLMLYVSFYLIFLYPLIHEKTIMQSTRILSLLLCFVSFYFLIWTFWYRGDFSKQLYYLAIAIASILGTVISVFTIRYRFNLKRKIGLLIKFISVDAYDKYVKIEDKDNYLDDSFTIYDEITK